MIKKIFIVCLWITCVLLIFLIPFAYIPSMYISSATEIKINNVIEKDYDEMKQDVKVLITKLNPPFDCEFDKKYWKANRDSGDLICQDQNYNDLYMGMKDSNISIYYDGGASFLLPTKEKITDEHKMIQGVFLGLGYYLQKKYNQDVKVIYYHRDLPNEGKVLF